MSACLLLESACQVNVLYICIQFYAFNQTKIAKKCYNILFLTDGQNLSKWQRIYEGRTESHEQLFFACGLGTADEGGCGGRWNQLLCYP